MFTVFNSFTVQSAVRHALTKALGVYLRQNVLRLSSKLIFVRYLFDFIIYIYEQDVHKVSLPFLRFIKNAVDEKFYSSCIQGFLAFFISFITGPINYTKHIKIVLDFLPCSQKA